MQNVYEQETSYTDARLIVENIGPTFVIFNDSISTNNYLVRKGVLQGSILLVTFTV